MSNLLTTILPFLVFYIPMFVLTIYCFILFIKLAKRGIKAFDIYIAKNENTNSGQ